MCKVFVRRRRTKTLHIIKKKARLRAKPGEEATFEKQSASILHRQMRSCILAIAENQSMQRVDALGKKTYQSFIQSTDVCWGQARRIS